MWESPPFELTSRNGQLYGRGVADDKANVVILLTAVEELVAARSLPVNIRFLIDAEEEVGGDSADEWLLSDTRDASAAVMLDGSVDELTVGVDGRLPPSLRVDAVSASEAERERWRGLRPGHELLAQAGLRAADAAAARDFHQRTRAEPALTITGIHSGEVSQFSASIPVEAEANITLRPVAGQSATALRSRGRAPASQSGSAGRLIEREANMHGPNERFAAAHVERGTDAMRQILTRLGEHP
jgi:acetylornithine deacetylase/succinyl-diaminopimelate desuccinylase-like protein